MKKIFNIKSILVVLSIIAISFTACSSLNYVNAWSTCMRVSPPSSKVVDEGGEVSFTLDYNNNTREITLSKNDLGLTGFSADVSIQKNGNSRVVKLTNIHNINGNPNNKSVMISEGTALSDNNELANAMRTAEFSIRASSSTSTPSIEDNVAPVASISGPNPSSVYAGGTVTYKVTYSDNVGISAITLNVNDIGLSGFTANKSISINGNVATITLSNIQGNVGGSKFIKVTAGSAIDAKGNMCNAVTGSAFSIVQKANNNNNNNNNNANSNKPNNNTNNNQNNGRPNDWVANPNTGK